MELLWEDAALDVHTLITRKHHWTHISCSAQYLTCLVNQNYNITNGFFDSHYGF